MVEKKPRMSRYFITVILLSLFWGVLFSYLTIGRHRAFHSNYYDLGIMDQTVYNTSRGRLLELTNPLGKGENTTRLALHVDPLLMILSPLYWIQPSVIWLLLVQSFVLASGAIALYLLAIHYKLSQRFAALISVLYLLYPPLQWTAIYDFHAVTLTTGIILWWLYFLSAKKYLFAFILFILALAAKEQVGLSLGFFSFLYLAWHFAQEYITHKKQGLLSTAAAFLKEKKYLIYVSFMAIGVSWFFLCLFIIIPHFQQGQHVLIDRYAELGDSSSEILKEIITRPLLIFQYLFSERTIRYVATILGPVGFISLLSPATLLGALPELLINTLSNSGNTTDIYHHYTAVMTPFIFLGAITGIMRLTRNIPQVFVSAFLLCTMIYSNYWYSPLPYSYRKDTFLLKQAPYYSADVKAFAQSVRDDTISISASETIAPHVSHRTKLLRFSPLYRQTEYVVLLREYVLHDWYDQKGSREAYEDLITDPDYTLIKKNRELEIWKRVSGI